MYEAILSGIIALAVCLINNFFQMKAVTKQHNDNIALISYRLEQLEKATQKHNNIIERTYELEKKQNVMEEQLKVANHRITDIERGHEA